MSIDTGTSQTVDPVTQKVTSHGEGGTPGYFIVAGGIAFQLNVLEPQTALNFDTGYGVNNTYLFFEMMRMGLTGNFGSTNAFVLSDTTWTAGLSFEF